MFPRIQSYYHSGKTDNNTRTAYPNTLNFTRVLPLFSSSVSGLIYLVRRPSNRKHPRVCTHPDISLCSSLLIVVNSSFASMVSQQDQTELFKYTWL